ncbi:hypothetical protein ACE1CD_17835 [Aerosakkonema sp. BLCC-F183]
MGAIIVGNGPKSAGDTHPLTLGKSAKILMFAAANDAIAHGSRILIGRKLILTRI